MKNSSDYNCNNITLRNILKYRDYYYFIHFPNTYSENQLTLQYAFGVPQTMIRFKFQKP